MMDFFRRLVDGLHWAARERGGYVPTYLDLNVAAVHFYRNLIFVRKGR